MKKVGNFLKNGVVSIDNRVNLILILILSMAAHWLVLYYFNFDQKLIKFLSNYIIPVSLLSFFVAYIFYMRELTNRTYENRSSLVRLFGRLLQIPNVILSGVSISIILAQIFYSAISDGTFLNFLPDLLLINICAPANAMFNYANERDLKRFIIPRKKKETLNFE